MLEYFNPSQTFEVCKKAYQYFIDGYHKFTNPEIKKLNKRKSFTKESNFFSGSNTRYVGCSYLVNEPGGSDGENPAGIQKT